MSAQVQHQATVASEHREILAAHTLGDTEKIIRLLGSCHDVGDIDPEALADHR